MTPSGPDFLTSHCDNGKSLGAESRDTGEIGEDISAERALAKDLAVKQASAARQARKRTRDKTTIRSPQPSNSTPISAIDVDDDDDQLQQLNKTLTAVVTEMKPTQESVATTKAQLGLEAARIALSGNNASLQAEAENYLRKFWN